jgi:type I restriction enzyme R subunit
VLDEQLAACGWVVQSRDGLNLGAGPGIAVREFGTGAGPSDYGLFVDKEFCGVIEAKPAGTTLGGYSDKAARYISEAPEWLGVDPSRRRFEYVASDTEILFRDHADPEPRSRRVFAFHRPETLRRWLSESATLRARLQHVPPLVTEGLRTCQIEAIEGLEKSLARGDPRALIQMTMGAGKTFTACTASYRLLAPPANLRRILFLVDRRNLGSQAAMEYASYRPPGKTMRAFRACPLPPALSPTVMAGPSLHPCKTTASGSASLPSTSCRC